MFITPEFADGGGETYLIKMLSGIDRERFECSLVCFSRQQTPLLERIPPSVPFIDLGRKHRYALALPRLTVSLLRSVRSWKPDVVVSMGNELTAILPLVRAVSRQNFGLIANVHINISSALDFQPPWRRTILRRMFRYLHGHVDLFVPVSQGVADDLARIFGSHERIEVVRNPVDIEEARTRAQEPPDHPWFAEDVPIILGIGRLIAQKGLDDLIRAFDKLTPQGGDRRLMILGEGELRAELQALIDDLGISERAILPGFRPNPFAYLAGASVFVLSSRWEAFPTVIAEAMAVGIPVVSTRCPSGPDEMIDDDVSGLLVPVGDADALAAAIDRVFADPQLRQRLVDGALHRVQDFDVAPIVAEFESRLDAVIDARRSATESRHRHV